MTNHEAQVFMKKLGIDLDTELLELALTHRSFSYENGSIPTNERLEFLGDSVLGLSVTSMLFRRYPKLSEGDLAKRRASLVSTSALAEVARIIALGPLVRLGRGESHSGGRDKSSILADTLEALIGAVYIDKGIEVASAFVLKILEPLLADPNRFGAALDPKTSLQERASQLGVSSPVYEISETGPDHSKSFEATVFVGENFVGKGKGTSKKIAEMAAALDAFSRWSV